MKFSRFALIAVMLVPTLALAQSPLRAPNWDKRLALETAQLASSEARVVELFEIARAAEHDALRENLDALISGRGYAAPARDYILFHFTIGLADFDRVDPAVLAKLSTVQPAVYVSHPERADFGVPLFDIAGAAAGVFRLNQRRSAAEQAGQGLDASTGMWVDAYLAASPAQRKGFVDALDRASDPSLLRIMQESIGRLAQAPELTPVAGKAALLLGSPGHIGEIVSAGSGEDLARILEASALTLPADARAGVLLLAVQKAPARNAALAIAQLYPSLADRADSTELLFDRLDDPELGAAAAMALARSGGPDTRARLRSLSAESEGPAASRAAAALALDPVPAGVNR